VLAPECADPESKAPRNTPTSRIKSQRSPDNAQKHRPENPRAESEAKPERAGIGVRLKWGDKLENGKGVVADANPPRTIPSQITTLQRASHAPFYAILAHSLIGRCSAACGAQLMHEATDRMLCHNMCRSIRVMRELDVEVTFAGERESTRALHLMGLLAYSRVPHLTCQYIYVKCT
jgi:hypothetical protein